MIFLDSAGSSLPPDSVLDTVLAHLRREAEVGGYRAAGERAEDLADGYHVFARLLGCAAEDIAFTDSATRSWLLLLDAVGLGAGDRVLISQVEYAANAVALYRLAELTGCVIERIPSDEYGQADVDAAREMLDERVKLVSIVHVPTNSGLISPVRELADAAHEVGALVLLDACQSVGHLPVRLDDLGVDMLTGTGRKWLRGPRGTGFLALAPGIAQRLTPRLFDHTGAELHGEGRFSVGEGATPYGLYEYGVAERLGLIAAARQLLELGVQEVSSAILERSDLLRGLLGEIDGVRVLDPGQRRSGIVTFGVESMAAVDVVEALWERGIVVTGGSPPGGRIDMQLRGVRELVRASPHYFVPISEIREMGDVVSSLVS